jgi:hypothetical protein
MVWMGPHYASVGLGSKLQRKISWSIGLVGYGPFQVISLIKYDLGSDEYDAATS